MPAGWMITACTLACVLAMASESEGKPTAEDKPIKLVTVAADAAYTYAINRGIIEGYEKGIITTASLITGGQWFHHMAEYANDHPDLTVGIHLALAGGLAPYPLRPVCSPSEVPSLVDCQGFLYDSYSELNENNNPTYEEVYREFKAQVVRAYQEGLDVAYVDSHVAMNEIASKAQQQVAREFCLPIKRGAGEIDIDDIYMTPNDRKSAKLAAMLDAKTTGPGVYLYRCHPAADIPESRALMAGNMPYKKGEWAAQRQAETDATTSPEVLEVIRRKDIQLVGHYKGVRDAMRAKLPAAEREAILARIAALKAPRDAKRNAPWSWEGTPAAICPATGPVTIDGDLAEFAGAAPIVIDGSNPKRVFNRPDGAWTGNRDLRAEMKMMYDAENLYIAVTVTDDTIRNGHGPHEVSKADCVEIFLCSDPALTDKYRGKVGVRSADRKLTLTPTSADGKPLVVSGMKALAEAEIACVRRPGGYILEARVPLAAVNGAAWKTGDKLRFEVSLHDADQRHETQTVIYWNAESRKAWGIPDLWGVAEIQ